MPTAHLNAKLVFVDVPSRDFDASLRFYSALFGTDELAPVRIGHHRSYFYPISHDGIDITLHERREDMEPPDIPIAYYAVHDLAEATKRLEEHGGEVKYGPVDVPLPEGKALEGLRKAAKKARQKVGEKVGQAVVMLDPEKNPVGLVELHDYAAYYFRAGAFHHPLRADQLEGVKHALAAHE